MLTLFKVNLDPFFFYSICPIIVNNWLKMWGGAAEKRLRTTHGKCQVNDSLLLSACCQAEQSSGHHSFITSLQYFSCQQRLIWLFNSRFQGPAGAGFHFFLFCPNPSYLNIIHRAREKTTWIMQVNEGVKKTILHHCTTHNGMQPASCSHSWNTCSPCPYSLWCCCDSYTNSWATE